MRALHNAARKVAEVILTKAKSYLLVSHIDADGLTSGHIMSGALKARSIEHKLVFCESIDVDHIIAAAEGWGGVIICDHGTAAYYSKELCDRLAPKPLIIIDHHRLPKSVDGRAMLLNLEQYGLDGDFEGSASSLTYLVTKKLGVADVRLAKLACLPPGSIVMANPAPVNIAEIKAGEAVMSSVCRPQLVTEDIQRQYSGKMIKIKPYYLPEVSFTPEHPILVFRSTLCKWPSAARDNERCKPTCKRMKGMCPLLPANPPPLTWVRAEDVKSTDFVVFPKYKEEEAKPTVIDLAVYASKNFRVNEKTIDFGQRRIPRFLTLDADLAKLFGWYLAEGYPRGRRVFAFGLSCKESAEARWIARTIRRLFGIRPRIVKTRTWYVITASSAIHEAFLRDVFGSPARRKKIPPWILNAKKELLKIFINAYHRGDGYVGEGQRHVFTTASRLLAAQLLLVLNKLGYVGGVVERTRPRWRRQLLTSYDVAFYENHRLHYYLETEDNYLIPIRKVSTSKYSGKVYNLETTDHTYLVPFVVHNCTGSAGDWQKFVKANAIPLTDLVEAHKASVLISPDAYGLSRTAKRLITDHLRDYGREHMVPQLDALLSKHGVDRTARWQELGEKKRAVLIVDMKKYLGVEFAKKVLFTDEDQRSPYSNPYEFATMFNSAILAGFKTTGPDTIAKLCAGDRSDETLLEMERLRHEQSSVLMEIYEKVRTGEIPLSTNYDFIQHINLGANYVDRYPVKLVGTLASQLARKPAIRPYKYVLVVAQTSPNAAKISIRAPEKVGKRIADKVYPPVGKIAEEVAAKYKAEFPPSRGGGHDRAGGMVVSLTRVGDVLSDLDAHIRDSLVAGQRAEVAALAAVLLSREQVDRSYVTEFYVKKAKRFMPGERVVFVARLMLMGKGNLTAEDLVSYLPRAYFYFKQAGRGAFYRVMVPTTKTFIDPPHTVYYYTEELTMPPIPGRSRLVSLVDIVKDGLAETFTLDDDVTILGAAELEWAVGRSPLLFSAICHYLRRMADAEKRFDVRYCRYKGPTRMFSTDPAEREAKVATSDDIPEGCIPQHWLERDLPAEIEFIAKEYGFTKEDVEAALRELREKGLREIIDAMSYRNLVAMPVRGTVIEGGDVYHDEYLVRPTNDMITAYLRKRLKS